MNEITEVVEAEYGRSLEKISDILVASTSHDMRTPLNTIINMHTLIDSHINDPKLSRWVKVAKVSTQLLLYLVNDTLDYY